MSRFLQVVFFVLLFQGNILAQDQCVFNGANPSSVNFYSGKPETIYVQLNTSGYCSGSIVSCPSWVTANNYGSQISVAANLNTGPHRSGTVVMYFPPEQYAYISVSQPADVPPLPFIYIQPTTITRCFDKEALFEISAGDATSYQWQRRVPGGGWENLVGETSRALRFIVVETPNLVNYFYRCLAINSQGSTASQEAQCILSYNTTPMLIGRFPQSARLCFGKEAEIYIEVLTSYNSIQWQVKKLGSNEFVAIPGATGTHYKFYPNENDIGSNYRCRISKECYLPYYSNSVGLIFESLPLTIQSQPIDATICKGDQAQYFVGTTYSDIRYQWRYSVSSGGIFKDILGMDQPYLAVPPNLNIEGYVFKCILSSPSCNVNAITNAAILHVTPNSAENAIITAGPAGEIYSGDKVDLTVSGSLLNPSEEWEWFSKFNNSYISLGNGSGVSVRPMQSSTYYVRGTACGIASAKNININVIERLSLNENYIHETTANVALTEGELPTFNEILVADAVTYFDGLGRAMQNVRVKQSPNLFQDLITPIGYDGLGRQSKNYLPYVSGSSGYYRAEAILKTGQYELSDQARYYLTPSETMPQDSKPYQESVFEPSPLNRVDKAYSPGQAWRTGDHFVDYQYLVNENGTTSGQEKIIAWKIHDGKLVKMASRPNEITSDGHYVSGQLNIKIVADENGAIVREYTNKKGQIILKKVQTVKSSQQLNNPEHWAQTYYVFDELDNLYFVLPPEATKTFVTSGN